MDTTQFEEKTAKAKETSRNIGENLKILKKKLWHLTNVGRSGELLHIQELSMWNEVQCNYAYAKFENTRTANVQVYICSL